MIARHWRGLPKADQIENYTRYFLTETFPRLAKIAGFLSASILTRRVLAGTEFLIVSYWESLDAIQHFSGDDPELAVIPDAVRAMMSDYDIRAVHYGVIETYDPTTQVTHG